MKKLILLVLAFTVLGCFKISKNKFEKQSFGIVIHGGAGTILKENMTEEKKSLEDLKELKEKDAVTDIETSEV